MATPSSPTSSSNDNSPRSSPTRSDSHSYLPSQAAHTSPARNTNVNSHTSLTPRKLPKRETMPSPSEFERKGFSRVPVHNHQSTPEFQASNLPQLQNGAGQQVAATSLDKVRVEEENSEDQNTDPMADLPLKDWQELETRFERDMEAAIQHEQSIMDEIEWVMKACNDSAKISTTLIGFIEQMMKESTMACSTTELERAKKRLRTRVAYVQQSEEALAEKREHYKGVVDAFQNAMALLGGL